MKPARIALLAFAALLLPSCGHRHHEWVHVTVHNEGTVPADVHAEAEYWPDFGQENHAHLSVSPGETSFVQFRFDDLERLKVRIYRSTDDEKIFDETWDRNELEDLDENVTITISP
jgi:hypothetical protein